MILLFISISIILNAKLEGDYVQRIGHEFYTISLQPDKEIEVLCFNEFSLFGNKPRTVGSYFAKNDTLYIDYKKRKFENTYRHLVGNKLIIEETDELIALIPLSRLSNWNERLELFEGFKKTVPKASLVSDHYYLAFENTGIFIKLK